MMKNILLLIMLSSLIASCDPDIAGEGINLPAMEFAFTVNPDTAYIKLGDTLTLESSISNILEGEIQLTDGEAVLGFVFWYYPNNPITQGGGEHALENIHYSATVEEGGFVYNTNNANRVQDLKTWVQGNMFKMKYHFVFIKKGVYVFSLSSKFYEGTKGKTRTNAYFDVINHNWSFYQIPGEIIPTIGDPIYDKKFLIAVTD